MEFLLEYTVTNYTTFMIQNYDDPYQKSHLRERKKEKILHQHFNCTDQTSQEDIKTQKPSRHQYHFARDIHQNGISFIT